MDHHSHNLQNDNTKAKRLNHGWLAFSATFHCLLGCGLGEIGGMVLGTWQAMSNITTMILALVLGAFFGLLFGIIPLLRAGFSFAFSIKQVLIAEGLSILVMESVEVLVQVNTPGVMNAHLSDWLFWKGMFLGLAAGFIAAYPVNLFFIKKGIGHRH